MTWRCEASAGPGLVFVGRSVSSQSTSLPHPKPPNPFPSRSIAAPHFARPKYASPRSSRHSSVRPTDTARSRRRRSGPSGPAARRLPFTSRAKAPSTQSSPSQPHAATARHPGSHWRRAGERGAERRRRRGGGEEREAAARRGMRGARARRRRAAKKLARARARARASTRRRPAEGLTAARALGFSEGARVIGLLLCALTRPIPGVMSVMACSRSERGRASPRPRSASSAAGRCSPAGGRSSTRGASPARRGRCRG